jgi:hypothetical protein
VGAPSAGTEIHFDVAGKELGIPELQDGVSEVGTAGEALKTGMKDTEGSTV